MRGSCVEDLSAVTGTPNQMGRGDVDVVDSLAHAGAMGRGGVLDIEHEVVVCHKPL